MGMSGPTYGWVTLKSPSITNTWIRKTLENLSPIDKRRHFWTSRTASQNQGSRTGPGREAMPMSPCWHFMEPPGVSIGQAWVGFRFSLAELPAGQTMPFPVDFVLKNGLDKCGGCPLTGWAIASQNVSPQQQCTHISDHTHGSHIVPLRHYGTTSSTGSLHLRPHRDICNGEDDAASANPHRL